MIYHDGPDNSTGMREIVPLGLPELGLNFTWHDWGHFAATKSFDDPVCMHLSPPFSLESVLASDRFSLESPFHQPISFEREATAYDMSL